MPPVELIRHLFDYDTESGVVIWKNPRSNRTKKGAAVGCVCQSNCKTYLKVSVAYNGGHEEYKLHRIIWLYVTGEDPGAAQIDHIDGNTLNNSFANLRKASPFENQYNCKLRIDNTSGFKGVSWSKRRNKWFAQISANRKQLHLGYFDTPELAHMAYCKAAAELHGEFARGA